LENLVLAWFTGRVGPMPAPASHNAAPRRGASLGLASAQREMRLEAGRLGHALLQYLPAVAPADRSEAGRRYLTNRSVSIEKSEQQAILTRTLAVLDNPTLAALFGSDSRSEVTITAEFARQGAPPASFVGRIDRLAITADHVLIADFKSGSPTASAPSPAEYIAQLAIYRGALLPLYPNLPVRAYLVWLETAEALEISPDALDSALLERLAAVQF
jgi:ATP-dependent helicase/nuclease subunit A